MTSEIEPGTWLADLVEAYSGLGGEAPYSKVYAAVEGIRRMRGGSWTREAKASVRRTVEDHSDASKNYRGKNVFYSVHGLGRGVWGLLPEYRKDDPPASPQHETAYGEGIEGITKENRYLRRSRSVVLVERRKLMDSFTCQVCGFVKKIGEDRYIIDVHHLNPLGLAVDMVTTKLEDLVCLCPNCHRIAHSRPTHPYSLDDVRKILSKP